MILNSIFNFFFLKTNFLEDDLALLAILLGVIYIALFVMRKLQVLKKRTCPSCSGKLSRKKRNALDKLVVLLTLNILPFKRYKCIHCGWEGLRWNTRKGDAYKTIKKGPAP